MVLEDECIRLTAASAEGNKMSDDKTKSSSDERIFAVISTPKSSQPVSDQITVTADAAKR